MATIPPLAIVQARMGSTRLPGKMMLPLAGRPLIWWAWRRAIEAFGEANVVVAIPDTEENRVIREFIVQEGGTCFEWGGPEEDVLGRLFHCAHTFRWHPHTVILRVTPDDPEKDPQLMAQVAGGVRHPVELSCEALTLEQLGFLHYNVEDAEQREHLTLLYPVPPPEPPPGVWSIDTEEDYETVKGRLESLTNP